MLAFLRTCKQIYQEASGLFFSCSNFHLKDINHLYEFLWYLPTEHRKDVRSLSFYYDAKHRLQAKEAFELLSELTGLKTLRLLVVESHWQSIINKETNTPLYPDTSSYDGVGELCDFISGSRGVNIEIEGSLKLAEHIHAQLDPSQEVKILVHEYYGGFGSTVVREIATAS
jgi:hypothetical protein